MIFKYIARKRVQRGYTWLTNVGPRHGLDFDRATHPIRVLSCERCPLSQSAGESRFFQDVTVGLIADGVLPLDSKTRNRWMIRHGFNVGWEVGDFLEDALEEEWAKVRTHHQLVIAVNKAKADRQAAQEARRATSGAAAAAQAQLQADIDRLKAGLSHG